MNKDKDTPRSPYLAAGIAALVLALFIFFILKLVPILDTFLLSFKNYTYTQGLLGSPWVGLRNYEQLFMSYTFPRLFANSFVLAAAPAALGLAAAFFAGWGVGSMRRGFLRSLLTGLLLLPAFIPEVSVASAALRWNSLFNTGGAAPPLVNADVFPLVIIILSAVRVASVAAFVCAAAEGLARDAGKRPAAGSGLGAGVMGAFALANILTPNFALLNLLSNPLVYESADTLDANAYRIGMINMSFSASAAGWIFKTVLQLIAALCAALLLYYLLHTFFQRRAAASVPARTGTAGGVTAVVVSAAIVLLIAVFAFSTGFFAQGSGAAAQGAELIASSATTGLLTAGLSLLIFLFFIFLFSLGFHETFGMLPVLLAVLLAAFSNNHTGEYIFFRSSGLINTLFSLVLQPGAVLPLAFAAAFLARLRGEAAGGGNYFRMAPPYLLLFTGLHVALTWGDATQSMIFINRQDLFGPGLLLRQTITAGGFQGSGGLNLLVLLPALLLGLLCVFLYARLDGRGKSRGGAR